MEEPISPTHINFRRELKSEIPSTSYLSHGIDRYPAKTIPQISRYLIKKYSKPHDIILDPFCGSGSVLVESKLLKRNAIGCDINPLALLFSEVKTAYYTEDSLNTSYKMVTEIINKNKFKMDYTFPNQDYWFTPKALSSFSTLRNAIEMAKQHLNELEYKFLLCTLATIVRKCSKADPRGPKPFISKRMRELNLMNNLDPIKQFNTMTGIISKKLLESSKAFGKNNSTKASLLNLDAREIDHAVEHSSIDLVVSSPPYINAQDYVRSSKLELWILKLLDGEEIKTLSQKIIGTDRVYANEFHQELPVLGFTTIDKVVEQISQRDPKKAFIVYKYFGEMNIVLQKLKRVLNSDRTLCLIIGENKIAEVSIPTYACFVEIATKLGFDLRDIYCDIIKARCLPRKRNNNSGIISKDWILSFTTK